MARSVRLTKFALLWMVSLGLYMLFSDTLEQIDVSKLLIEKHSDVSPGHTVHVVLVFLVVQDD